GDLQRATERLEAARTRASRGEWLRTSAYVSRIAGDLHKSLETWKELLEREPLAPDANESVADLLGQLVGQDEAWRHVQEMAARFPFNYAVRSTQLERARNHSPQEAERVARELTALHPQDPWARRELVSALSDQRRFDEALVEARGAIELDPNAAAGHFFLGMVHEELRNIDEARQAYHRALELSIDYLPPMSALVGLCETRADRVAELQFIAEQLRLQVNYGDGVLHYRSLASKTLEPSEIVELMRAAWQSRPDLWQTWSGLVRQALDCGDIEEAQRVAEEAVRRFPLVPRLWLDLAQVQETLCDKDAQYTAIQRALEIAPSWTLALRLLADMQEARGEGAEAVKTLQRAIRHSPLESDTHVALAELFWRSERHDEAFEQLERTVQIEPGDERAWQLLRSWASERGLGDRALAAARRLADERPREARSFVVLADTLDDFDQTEEALQAIEQALELNPTLENAHSLKAYLLSKLDRPDEALAACSPPIFGDSPPLTLRARAAQVQANRGENQDAIARVREITQLDPDFYWAWNQLAEWSDRVGDLETSLAATEQMVRLSAERPTSHGYLGDALLRLNRREDAKLAFERAVNLAHDYQFAVRSLADLYLEDGEQAKLSQMLEKSASCLPPGLDVAYRMQMARSLNDEAAIPAMIDELLARPIDDEWTLNFAFKQLERLRLSSTIVGRLRQRAAAGDAPPAILSCWGRWEACFAGSEFYTIVASMQEKPEQFVPAVLTWCEEVETYFKPAPLHELQRRFGPLLQADTRLWLAVGQALLICNDYVAAAKWLADAPQREDCSSFALFLSACVQYGLRDNQRALELHRLACER
ncbi:MAG TPA: tetratricopeptide repeat protein, partial [Pirellulaceae bacterium]|nr:tetratricopeptide repeat protein [Pirellulaceae bacterium]